MRKKLLSPFYILFLLLFLFTEGVSFNEISEKEKALHALQLKDYSTTIKICLQQLESTPNDYDFNFMLSKAYAYSGEWDKALEILNKMLILYPKNIDLLLSCSRIDSWKGNFEEAESGYNEVLKLSPNNIEALTGIAEIATWKKNHTKAIEIYQRILQLDPSLPDTYYRIGKIYQWDGNYSKAKENFKKALNLSPENKEYKLALDKATPHFEEKFEIRYQYTNESFNDGRPDYIDNQFVFGFRIPQELGSLFLKYNRTKRFNKQDVQYEIELYPRLWPRAYSFLDFNYSSKAIHYPRTSYLVEIYQALFTSMEISLGYRRMNFKADTVSIYLGSIGYYLGNYYSFLRYYYIPQEKSTSFSWIFNMRRYFSKDNYVFMSYGQGSRPIEIVTAEDLFTYQNRIFLVGFDWYFLKGIKLQFHFSHRSEENGLKRNTFLVITGYRW